MRIPEIWERIDQTLIEVSIMQRSVEIDSGSKNIGKNLVIRIIYFFDKKKYFKIVNVYLPM